MSSLLTHPVTERYISGIIKTKPQAILISGLPGAGKYTTAKFIIDNIDPLNIDSNLLHFYQKPITIDNVREIYNFAKLKSKIKRFVIIENIDHMTNEAQNALLKVLEEPPDNTYFITTSSNVINVLPTVLSRLQVLPILTPSKEASVEYFRKSGSSKEIDSAYLISNGQPGLMASLLSDEDHYLYQYIESAKTILLSNTYDRLTMIDSFIKNKLDVTHIIYALTIVIKGGLHVSVYKNQHSSIRWQQMLKKITAYHDLWQPGIQQKLFLSTLLTDL